MKKILLMTLTALVMALPGCAFFETKITWLDNAPKTAPEPKPPSKPAS